jgi:hypothetical protein
LQEVRSPTGVPSRFSFRYTLLRTSVKESEIGYRICKELLRCVWSAYYACESCLMYSIVLDSCVAFLGLLTVDSATNHELCHQPRTLPPTTNSATRHRWPHSVPSNHGLCHHTDDVTHH